MWLYEDRRQPLNEFEMRFRSTQRGRTSILNPTSLIRLQQESSHKYSVSAKETSGSLYIQPSYKSKPTNCKTVRLAKVVQLSLINSSPLGSEHLTSGLVNAIVKSNKLLLAPHFLLHTQQTYLHNKPVVKCC